MKKIAAFVSLLSIASTLCAQEWVNGYTRQNGTTVDGHYRSTPNGNPNDNWTTKGNYNPYTGEAGTRNPQYGGSGSTPVYGGFDGASSGRRVR